MTEGYFALALDDDRYLEIAANLALSVRRCERRPISVAINRAVTFNPAYRPLFDQVIEAPDHPTLRGAMNKARLFELTPYERTLYVDADCLLFSPRIEFFWRKYRDHPFAVEGQKLTKGPVFSCSLGEKDAATLCRLLDIPYLSAFNAGVMYFERTAASKAVFDKVLSLFDGPHRDAISYRYKHAGEYADEPFFGAALGALDIAPFEPPLTQRLQVTTPNIVDGVMNLDLGELSVIKKTANGQKRVWSGVMGHFCGLAPIITYFELADQLRREGGLPPMDRGKFNPVVLKPVEHREADSEADSAS